MVSWLQGPDPSVTHNRLQSEHHEGTGEWFLKCNEFERWMKTPGGMLWIQGIRELLIWVGSCLSILTRRHYSRKWEERPLVRSRGSSTGVLTLMILSSAQAQLAT
jgi:hypothetical protein